MHCPVGLLWDDNDKICLNVSSTCMGKAKRADGMQSGNGNDRKGSDASTDGLYY